MAFENFIQDSFSSYHGIRVSTKSVSVSMSVAKILRDKGYKRVNFEYDREEGLIRLVKCDKGGFRVGWGQIAARIVRVMPEGRYGLIKSGPKEFLFKKSL